MSDWTRGLIVLTLLLGSVQAVEGAIVINFDCDPNGQPINAPWAFAQTTRLTTLYSPWGVTFVGPGGNDGGAILHECGGFGVNAVSGTNFLAFNDQATLADGGTPRDPQTILFSSLISMASICVAPGWGGSETFYMNAYKNNVLVDSDTVTTPGCGYAPMTVSSPGGIDKIMLLHGVDNAFVFDNLTYELATPAIPEPGSLIVWSLLGALGIAVGWWRRRSGR